MSKAGKKKIWGLVAVVIIVVIAVAGVAYYMTIPSAPPPKKPVKLTMSATGVGGSAFIVSSAMCETAQKALPEGSAITVIPGGSFTNVERLDENVAQIGLAEPNVMALAYAGKPPFTKVIGKEKVVGLINVQMSSVFHIVALEESGIKSIEGIKGKPIRLLMREPGSLAEEGDRVILEGYGITYEKVKSWGGTVSYVANKDAVSLLKDGLADVWGCIGGVPFAELSDLASVRKVRVLPVSEEVRNNMVKLGYAKWIITKGIYPGQTEDIPTVGSIDILVCRSDLPNDVAYTFVKAICENAEKIRVSHKAVKDWDPKKAADVGQAAGVPLHLGAEKYFKERGYL